MNRRETLKNIFLASGTLVALPSWAKKWTTTDFGSYTTSFSVTEQELLASVVDTIIPAGDSVGAISVGVDKFFTEVIRQLLRQYYTG